MKKLEKVLGVICCIGIILLLQQNIFASTYIEHNVNYGSKNNTKTIYLPTSSNNVIEQFTGINYHPVTIRVFYHATISANAQDFVGIYSPSITARILNPDNSIYQEILIANGSSQDKSSWIDIPPNKGLSVSLFCGEQAKHVLGFQVAWLAYALSLNLKYKWDDAAPNMPTLTVKNPTGDQVTTINGKTYTKCANPVLVWSATDNAATYQGFAYGPSGIKDYLVDSNGSQQWTTNNQLSLPDGEYQVC